MNHQDLITLDLAVRSGKPCLVGTRSTVHDVLDDLASGMEVEAICDDFPDRSPLHVRAALQVAADRERHLAA